MIGQYLSNKNDSATVSKSKNFLDLNKALMYDQPNMNWHYNRGKNSTNIFGSYSRPNSFREVQICPYPSPNIQHLIPYLYPNTKIINL